MKKTDKRRLESCERWLLMVGKKNLMRSMHKVDSVLKFILILLIIMIRYPNLRSVISYISSGELDTGK